MSYIFRGRVVTGILFSRLVVSMFMVLLGIVSVDMAHAAAPGNACLSIKGKVYIFFFERPLDTQAGGTLPQVAESFLTTL